MARKDSKVKVLEQLYLLLLEEISLAEEDAILGSDCRVIYSDDYIFEVTIKKIRKGHLRLIDDD